MISEKTVYSRAWLRDRMKFFVNDATRSVAFGLIMSVSVFILFSPFLISGYSEQTYDVMEADGGGGSTLILMWFFVGLPICVLCWWGAIEVASDSHWETESTPSIWENQEARMLESTVYLARQLEGRGNKIDMSMVMSDDIHSKAHELIDQLDAPALRLYMVALLGGLSEHKAIQEGHVKRTAYLCEPEGDVESNE